MNRSQMLAALEERAQYDVVVIGGGATGLGVALDSAVRGYRTLLLEQDDFAKGTSSRSTKLVHGGVRYLQQGNVSLVLEALRERGLLIRNAPHLVRNLGFVVPNYDWWEGPFYGIGLKVYDMLAGRLGLGPSRWLSREETLERLPTIEPEGLRGGVIYYDGQFDDARLAITLARTAERAGATLLNYARVDALLKANGRGLVTGVRVTDLESGREHEVRAKVVVNATGVFTDAVLRMDSADARPIIEPSQGVHIVLDQSFHPADNAIMVPKTDDGRVLFAVPWHGRVIVGTTDTPVESATLEPRALDEEVDFLLEHAARYLAHDPTRADVLSVFAGLRPLVRPADERDTASISRDHTLTTSASGLVTITGGKWTTYRKMAQDTIDQAIVVGGLEPRPCTTEELELHGVTGITPTFDVRSLYGGDGAHIAQLEAEQPELAAKLHPSLPYTFSEIVWGARHEMARTLEDALSRRTRSLLLDSRASVQAAPAVARVMAAELGRDEAWQNEQVAAFSKLAESYRLEWRKSAR